MRLRRTGPAAPAAPSRGAAARVRHTLAPYRTATTCRASIEGRARLGYLGGRVRA
jgi:hypothetical protein